MRSPDPLQHTRAAPTPGAPSTATPGRAVSAGRRRLTVLLAAFLFVGAFAVLTATAPAAHANDADYLAKINALRTSHGLNPLAIDGNMDSLAQQHTQQMAAQQTLVHTSNLKAGVTSNWTKVGENVGEGGSNNQIWDAFLKSSPHLANLLDPAFTHVGIGVVVDSAGVQWTTHRFIAITDAPPPAPAPAPVVTAPRPVVTAPPVTRPPVTAPRPVVTAPPTTAPPVPAGGFPSVGDGSGEGSAGADGGPNDLSTSDVPANPARVGSVIDSLRALN